MLCFCSLDVCGRDKYDILDHWSGGGKNAPWILCRGSTWRGYCIAETMVPLRDEGYVVDRNSYVQ